MTVAVETNEANLINCSLDLRHNGLLPKGKCLYIQSGDPGDFDGYLIGIAGEELSRKTQGLEFALVIPERRACADRTATDVNAHDPVFSEQVMQVAGQLTKLLCPGEYIVRGPLNQRNIIPLRFIFSEPEQYAPTLKSRPSPGAVLWHSVADLAGKVMSPEVSSVLLDMNGALGYLPLLQQLCGPVLGQKMKACGMPVCVMAGILAEAEITTLRVPGRDPRATMNAIYHASSVATLLALAKEHQVPLLFVTNNVCNQLLKYEDVEQLAQAMGLKGLLLELAEAWYGPHLKGKCVPFDWVSFCAMCFHERLPGLVRTEKRQLHVGKGDASILVLLDPALPSTPTSESALEGTELWGEVDTVTHVDVQAMLDVAKAVAASHVV